MKANASLLTICFFLCFGNHSQAGVLTAHAVIFDGGSVPVAALPALALKGAKDLQEGALTRGDRYIRAQSTQSADGDTCPFIAQTQKLAVDFSTTCRLRKPTPQKMDIWLPGTRGERAALTVEIESASDVLVAVSMTLKEKGAPTLEWSYDQLQAGGTIIFSFAKKANGPAPGGAPAPSNLSDVIFLIIDYR